MHIRVTQQNIDQGTRGCAQNCAIARAVNEHVPNNQGVIVGADGIEIKNYFTAKYPINPEVKRFIDAYDRGDPVKPFEFDVEEYFEEEDVQY